MTINIIITFIVILFAFLSASVIYFKSNKVSKTITEIIQKYEGYNDLAKKEIALKLESIGYNKKRLNSCDKIDGCSLKDHNDNGYCVYLCEEKQQNGDCEENYYYYKIKTNMILNVPIINEVLDIPVFSNTKKNYDFEYGCVKGEN